jgi:hypothetical protein
LVLSTVLPASERAGTPLDDPVRRRTEEVMTPHPILMHTLHDDRTREVEALLLQRQRVDQGNVMRAQVSPPGIA